MVRVDKWNQIGEEDGVWIDIRNNEDANRKARNVQGKRNRAKAVIKYH